MTVYREHGVVCFECDTCATVLDTNTDEWDQALDCLHGEGWYTKRKDREWLHTCDACKK